MSDRRYRGENLPDGPPPDSPDWEQPLPPSPAERRRRFALRDETTLLDALSTVRFEAAVVVAKRCKRALPKNDVTPTLMRLRKQGLVYSMPLRSGKLGWRRTAAGTEALADRDRSHFNGRTDGLTSSKGRTARRRRKRGGRNVGPKEAPTN